LSSRRGDRLEGFKGFKGFTAFKVQGSAFVGEGFAASHWTLKNP
jgi:hypothetical protein